jgi:hypothetical protein
VVRERLDFARTCDSFEVIFYGCAWCFLGTKRTGKKRLSEKTRISVNTLDYIWDLRNISIAPRMSWALRRNTTKREDEAYCLLGIFGVRMLLLYGEGVAAFRRFQEETIKAYDDNTIFLIGLGSHIDIAVRHAPADQRRIQGLLARSPNDFELWEHLGHLTYQVERPQASGRDDPPQLTNPGLRISLTLTEITGLLYEKVTSRLHLLGHLLHISSVSKVGRNPNDGFPCIFGVALGCLEFEQGRNSGKEVVLLLLWASLYNGYIVKGSFISLSSFYDFVESSLARSSFTLTTCYIKDLERSHHFILPVFLLVPHFEIHVETTLQEALGWETDASGKLLFEASQHPTKFLACIELLCSRAGPRFRML